MAQVITHQGTVENVNGKHISVRITQTAACSTCVAKKMCNSSESKDKRIDVIDSNASSYHEGEEVLLTGSLEMGLKAVLLAYIIPLVLLVSILLLSVHFTANEPLAALGAIGGLTVYYTLLYFNKGRLTRKFSFIITHIK